MFRFSTSTKNRILSFTAALSLLALTTGLTVSTAAPVQAQATKSKGLSPKAIAQYAAVKTFIKSFSPTERKIYPSLVFASRKAAGKPLPFKTFPDRAGQTSQDTSTRVRVNIRGTVSDDLLKAIQNAGGQVVYASHRKLPAYAYPITAYLPPAALTQIAGRADVSRIRPAATARTKDWSTVLRPLVPLRTALIQTGSVDSEGDRTHGADGVRATYGVSGAGVRIGVISDSTDGIADSQKSGDLGNVTILADALGNTGEGTAMLEIVHDLAPGAQLYFATAYPDETAFADNIIALRDAGCDIIVDDVGYQGEPAFQDGIVAQAVDEVNRGGVAYFSAQGNNGNMLWGTSQAWEGDFQGGNELIDANGIDFGQIHQFGGQDFNQPNGLAVVYLQWSDAFGASGNDYDLLVFDKDDNLVSFSADFQSGDGDPIEGNSDPSTPVIAINDGGTYRDRIYVVKYNGDARALHLYTFNAPLTISTNSNAYDHSAGPSCIGVGATPALLDAKKGPYPNLFNTIINLPGQPYYVLPESFSSDGPRAQFYNPDGSDITPGNYLLTNGGGRVTPKPDLTAADGVKTSQKAFNPFYGTSAAAPHAAAIGGLIKSYRPTFGTADWRLTGEGIKAVLRNSCIDLYPLGGLDDTSGPGVVMATKAFTFINKFLDKSSIQVSNITDTSATFSWATNLPSDTFLDYRLTSVIPGAFTSTPVNSEYVTSHTMKLTGLKPNTRYDYAVRSDNSYYGMFARGPVASFVTKPINPPGSTASVVISNVTLTRGSQNNLLATISLFNAGGKTAYNAQIVSARLGATNSTTPMPVTLTAIPANSTGTTTVAFPSSIAKGTQTTVTVKGIFAGTTLSYSATITVP